MFVKIAWLVLAGGVALLGQSCTYRAWYEGLQERQRQECYRSPNQSEIQRCLESVNSVAYDEYRRSRKDTDR
jgi:hypothetical protein